MFLTNDACVAVVGDGALRRPRRPAAPPIALITRVPPAFARARTAQRAVPTSMFV